MKSLGLLALALAGAAIATPPAYNATQGLVSVWYCAAVYCNPPTLNDWTCNACVAHGNIAPPLKNVVQITNSTWETAGYVGYNPADGGIVVAFRGSQNLPNWILNLQSAFLEPVSLCNGCEMADGFYEEGYLGLARQMLAAIDALPNSANAPITVTGHSLGAAMAQIATYELVAAGYNVVSAYSIGTPRVGNPAWASSYLSIVENGDAVEGVREYLRSLPAEKVGSPVLQRAIHAPVDVASGRSLRAGSVRARAAIPAFRIIHWEDPVPHLPPMALGFQHPPTEVWYTESQTSYTVCSRTNGEDPACSDSILPIDTADHDIYLGVRVSSYC